MDWVGTSIGALGEAEQINGLWLDDLDMQKLTVL